MKKWDPVSDHNTGDHVGLRWKMAVKVRMGEKELLQAMKQAVVMLMLDSQGPDDGDSDEDDASSPDDDGEEEDSAGSGDQHQEHGEPQASWMLCQRSLVFSSVLQRLKIHRVLKERTLLLSRARVCRASGCRVNQYQRWGGRAGQSGLSGGKGRARMRAGASSPVAVILECGTEPSASFHRIQKACGGIRPQHFYNLPMHKHSSGTQTSTASMSFLKLRSMAYLQASVVHHKAAVQRGVDHLLRPEDTKVHTMCNLYAMSPSSWYSHDLVTNVFSTASLMLSGCVCVQALVLRQPLLACWVPKHQVTQACKMNPCTKSIAISEEPAAINGVEPSTD